MTSLVSLRAALNKADEPPWAYDRVSSTIGCDLQGSEQEFGDMVVDGLGELWDPNGELIVAAVNALPALLNVAQAAQTFTGMGIAIQDDGFVSRFLALCEALRALEKQT